MPRVAVVTSALLVAGSFLVVLAPPAEAQPGFITGTVRDIAGEPIVGAEVVGENPRTQRNVAGTTNDSGRFSFVGLESGRWLFMVRRRGYESVQGFANISASGNSRVGFVMEVDPFHPPAPSTGILANLRADELQEALDAADAHFENGDFDAAIEAYQAVLVSVPGLTALHLQIGHAYEAKQDVDSALAAYRTIAADDPVSSEAQAAIDALLSSGGDR